VSQWAAVVEGGRKEKEKEKEKEKIF